MEYLITYLWSLAPVVELRGAIPIGYLHYNIPIVQSALLGIAGGLTITAASILALPIIVANLKYVPPLERLMNAVLKRTRKDYSKKMKLWGEFFLVILVAIPLPGSGAFTGSIVAYLFGIRPKIAFCLIGLGVAISGILVAFITLTGYGIWEFFTDATEVVSQEVTELVPDVLD